MDIKQFGKEIIERLLEGENDSIKILRQQFKDSKIKEVEYTGCGFFIHYSIDPKKEKRKRKNVEIGGMCKINNTDSLYDIILFIREGFIDFLEGVIFGNGEFPKEIDSYEFEPLDENLKNLEDSGGN